MNSDGLLNEPELSVILLTPDTYSTISKTVAHLRNQTICDRIQLVLVFPDAKTFAADDQELESFQSRIHVESGVTSIGAAYAAGIRKATAPVIVLAEDHSFPQPLWAAALVKAHREEDFAAVGPAIANANPHSIVSRADLLCAYGPWLHPATSSIQQHLPGHNSSYKREFLLQYGDRLDDMMEAESVLHWDLTRRGLRLFLEHTAVTAHTNFELWSSWVTVQYHSGRAFAASRSMNERWSLLRRLLFATAWPLIPLVRFVRIVRVLLRPGRISLAYAAALPAVLAGLVLSASGEAAGYLLGAGSSLDRMVEFEFHRDLHRKSAILKV